MDKRRELAAEYNKAPADEKKKVLERYNAVGKEFADKFLKLAEDNPKDPVATDAVFWVLQNASGGDAYEKAVTKVKALIAEAPIADVPGKLKSLRAAPPAVAEAVAARAEKEAKDPKAVDLTAWVATHAVGSPAGQKAAKTMVEKHPDHPEIPQVCQMLGRAENGEALLKSVLEKSTKPANKAAAALTLGESVVDKVDDLDDKPAEADKLAAQGEKYLTTAAELLKDNPEQKKEAESMLNALRHIRVGKTPPDIQGPDLDGKAFKLSDYRGKVVLLDFWGNW